VASRCDLQVCIVRNLANSQTSEAAEIASRANLSRIGALTLPLSRDQGEISRGRRPMAAGIRVGQPRKERHSSPPFGSELCSFRGRRASAQSADGWSTFKLQVWPAARPGEAAAWRILMIANSTDRRSVEFLLHSAQAQ
jgi:hypothetical protein